MSSVIRPLGNEPPSVYWKRRALVVGALVAVIATLGFLIFGGGGGSADEAAPVAAPSAEPSPTGTATGAPAEVTPTASASPSASPSPTAQECAESAVTVTGQVDGESFASGASPNITLTIANTGTTECQRDIGAGANEIVITSGGYHVWSSDDCDPSQSSDLEVLKPGAQAQVTVTWDRTLSSPGCTGSGSNAQPGTYEVEVRNGEITGEKVRFVLQ